MDRMPTPMLQQQSGERFIYFALAEEIDKVKIGMSTNVEKRIKSLQTACPNKLQVVLQVPGGTRHAESLFHDMFWQARCYGEWFDYEYNSQIKDFCEWANEQWLLRNWRYARKLIADAAKLCRFGEGRLLSIQCEYDWMREHPRTCSCGSFVEANDVHYACEEYNIAYVLQAYLLKYNGGYTPEEENDIRDLVLNQTGELYGN